MAENTISPAIYGMGVNYAAANQWYAYLPLENILPAKFKNLNLHLTRFSIPQMEMGSRSVSYKGYQKEIPTKIMDADSKQLTLEYLIDEKWENYKALYAWMSGTLGNINPVVSGNEDTISARDYLPLRIYLLDNYKKKIIQFLFQNCWIKVFGDLALEQNNSDVISHSFTFCYDSYTIEDI